MCHIETATGVNVIFFLSFSFLFIVTNDDSISLLHKMTIYIASYPDEVQIKNGLKLELPRFFFKCDNSRRDGYRRRRRRKKI